MVSGAEAKASPVSRFEEGSAQWPTLGGMVAHRAEAVGARCQGEQSSDLDADGDGDGNGVRKVGKISWRRGDKDASGEHIQVGNGRGPLASGAGRAATSLATCRHGTLGSWNSAWARAERRLRVAAIGWLRHGPTWHHGQKGAAYMAWHRSDFGVRGRDTGVAALDTLVRLGLNESALKKKTRG
jgi:hypothetical protein